MHAISIEFGKVGFATEDKIRRKLNHQREGENSCFILSEIQWKTLYNEHVFINVWNMLWKQTFSEAAIDKKQKKRDEMWVDHLILLLYFGA